MAGKSKKKTTKTNDKTKVYKTNTTNNKKEKKEKKKKKHPKLRLAIKIIFILAFLVILIGGGILAGFIFGAFGDEFKISKEQLLITTSNSEVYDINGNLITNLSGLENRKIITLDDMAPYLPVAFVSIEDERFYSHHGVDWKRTIGATLQYLFGNSTYGGSTITQQLVKNLTKEDEQAWQRKVKEISRALEVERLISKDQVLELYLNTIFMGDQAFGVEVAANYYFNKTAKELTLEECAFLAGINHSPNWYDPFHKSTSETDEEDNERIKNRTITVLDKMQELGKIGSQEEYDTAVNKVNEGLPFSEGNISSVVFSYHTDAAIEQILQQLMDENPEWSREMAKLELYGGNYKIYTTQDTGIQDILEEEVKKDKYIIEGRIKDEETGEYENSQTAMVILDHKTGYVVGCVGGTGEKTDAFGLNRATQLPRQPGSSIKPIAVVAPGIEKGVITAGSVYDDVRTYWGNWGPANYYNGFKGLSTLRSAIEISQNVVFVKMMADIGLENSIEFLRQMGVTTLSDDEEGLALALGGAAYGISALEMAGAYGTIANDGVYITPTFYTKVTDEEGNVVLEPEQETRRVMSEAASYVTKTLVMQPVVGSAGTASYCGISGMDVAAKTGTTDNSSDRWLCGFTPYYTATCWFGYDNQKERVRYSGSNPAGSIWDSVMTQVHSNLEGKRFEKPSGITYATICKDSGLLATDTCREDPRGDRTYTEVYVAGTSPSRMCECHVKVKICNDTNKVATEFCNNFTEKVFITRVNSDIDTAWHEAADAEYMLPTEICDVHTKPEEKPPEEKDPINDIINNIINGSGDGNDGDEDDEDDENKNTGNTTGNTPIDNTNTNIDNTV